MNVLRSIAPAALAAYCVLSGAVPARAAVVFADDPLAAGVTAIKAVHLAELRDAVNAARQTASLGAATFHDLSPAGLPVQMLHITELRIAIDEARTVLSLPQLVYTDPTLTTSTAIKANHIQELRYAARLCPEVTLLAPATTTFTANTMFTRTFTQTGGTNSVTFSLASGTLPAGVNLSPSGTLSGTPVQTGTFPITVMATDGNGCVGTSASYALAIVAPPVIFTFTASGPTQAVAAITLTGTFADGAGAITNDQDAQSIPAVSGTGYQVTPYVDTVYTLTVTNAAGDFVTSTVSAVMPAIVRINELNANISGSCDLIELRVVSGGSMTGYKITERNGGTGELTFTFPGFTVPKNAFVIVHVNSGSTTCNPGHATQETLSVLDQPSVIYGGNFDEAYDFWSDDNGLTATDNVITLFNASGTIIDALFVSDDPAGLTTSTATETAAAFVGAANQWSPALASYIDKVFRMNAVADLNATGTTVFGNSIQRIDNTDDNDKLDWTTGAGAAATWGVLNAGQTPFP